MRPSYYFVLTQPKPDQEEAYHRWYDDRHVHDLVAIPGIAAAQRFRLLDAEMRAPFPDCLAVYEIDDVPLAIAGLAERRGTDRMPSTDALNRERSRGVICDGDGPLAPSWSAAGGLVAFLGPAGGGDADDRRDGATVLFRAGPVQSRPGPLAFAEVLIGPGARDRGAARPEPVLEAMAVPIAPRIVARR